MSGCSALNDIRAKAISLPQWTTASYSFAVWLTTHPCIGYVSVRPCTEPDWWTLNIDNSPQPRGPRPASSISSHKEHALTTRVKHPIDTKKVRISGTRPTEVAGQV